MNEPNWNLISKVKQDICFLYHELSEYTGIMGDLAYGSFYALPYWEFLHLEHPQIREETRCFIRDGCLVMILAMAWDVIDGSGSYLENKFELCREAVGKLKAEDARTEKLIRTVKLALERSLIKRSRIIEHQLDREIEDLAVWVNYEYVYGYFRRTADDLQEEHDRFYTVKSFELQ